MWASEWAEFFRKVTRPYSIYTMVLTVCICALIETIHTGNCPWWFAGGAGGALFEWIGERAVKKAKVQQ